MAQILLNKHVNPAFSTVQPIGKCWVHNFINCHDELKSKYHCKYDYQQTQYENPKIIQNWFCLIQNTIAKYDIMYENIYNFNETDFQIRIIKTVKVITKLEKVDCLVITQLENWEWVTAIKAINLYNWALLLMVIFAGKVHQSIWYKDNLISNDWMIAVSENGWTNDILETTWFYMVFHSYTQAHTVSQYWLLILDGHGSHETPKFDHFCTEHLIIVLCISSHLSHLLQPLDVGCFAPLKRLYRKQVEVNIQLEINYMNKLEFLALYNIACIEALNINNICQEFVATGLVSYNSDQVLLFFKRFYNPGSLKHLIISLNLNIKQKL